MFRKITFAMAKNRVVRELTAGLAAFSMLLFLLSTMTVNSQTRQDGNDRAAAPSAVFTNSTAITISASGPATPYPSAITASGLPNTIPSTPGAIKVTLNGFSHTFPEDVGILLVGPTGAALNIQDGAGDGTDMVSVTYTISDEGATQLPATGAWAAGTYRPANYFNDVFAAPAPGTYQNPGPIAGGTATFASTFGGTNPNGVWNLFVQDFVAGDSGTIAGGWSLEIAGAAIASDAPVDLDGDGRTNFVVVRNTGGGSGGQVTWFFDTMGGGYSQVPWGISTDFFISEDFDGDGTDDIAVWRPVSPTSATWYILNSDTNTARVEAFGQSGDDPTVVGDYNNDGMADLAVYRAGATAGAQSTWFYRTVPNGPVAYVPWGQMGDFPAPGDYDGDGSADFVIQRNDGGGQARFWFLFANGTQDSVVFGTPTDLIAPGDYDGDGMTDIAVLRGVAGQIRWFYEPSSIAGIQVHQATWGNSATDLPTPGDYDGDGRSDFAIWRPSATPGASTFWVYSVGSGSVIKFAFGQNGDYPVANFNTH